MSLWRLEEGVVSFRCFADFSFSHRGGKIERETETERERFTLIISGVQNPTPPSHFSGGLFST